MGKILPDPEMEPRKESTSSPILFEDLSQDMRFISTEVQQALQNVSLPFKINSDVNPIHCRKALNVLECLRERLDKLCQNLSHSTSLSVMLSPSRYPILIDLHLTQKNTSQLMDQLDDYRVSCLRSSHHLYPRRREIMTLFAKVIRQLEEIPDLVTTLEKDVEVQEQKLCLTIKQKKPLVLSFVHSSSKATILREE